jgi:hypothetical protein
LAIAGFVRDDFLALTSVEGQYRFGGGPGDAGLTRDTTLRQLLDRAAGKLSRRRDLDPQTEAELNWIIGVNYRGLGEAARAVPYLERCVALRRQVLGRDEEATLNAQNSLGVAYQAAGKHDAALPLFEETWRQRKVRLGPDHPDTLKSMGGLALGYRDAGKLDQALPFLEETWRQMEARLGPDHPDTLRAVNNLATGYWSAHRLDRSIPLFEEALKLREKQLGRSHPDTLQIVANLSVNYKGAGRLSEALPLLEEAYRASRTIPTLRWVGAALLDGYAKAGRSAQAAALLKNLLADARKSLPKDSPQLAGALAQFGAALLQLEAYPEAESLLRESLAIRAKADPDAWSTFNVRSMLGGALLGQKKYAEAEPLLRQGYEGMKAREKAIPPIAAARLPEALDRLIELYTATSKPEEVKKWRAERARYDKGAASNPGEKK